jgi:hypothetical protein
MSWKSQRLPQVRGGDSTLAQLGAVSTWSFQLDPGEKGSISELLGMYCNSDTTTIISAPYLQQNTDSDLVFSSQEPSFAA